MGIRLPLTSYHDLETAKQVAGLVRWQLREMGFRLPSAELDALAEEGLAPREDDVAT
jgi:hypothetical protein